MALPNSYRWFDDADGGAHLYQNYGCVAVIKPDGTTRLKAWQKEFHSKAASVAQAKRFIERWINADSKSSARQLRTTSSPNRLLASSSAGLSTRTIKIGYLPDDFERIADVHQPLAPFMRLAGGGC